MGTTIVTDLTVACHNLVRRRSTRAKIGTVARLLLPALAIAYGAASAVVALDRAPSAPTTYAATSGGTAAADGAAGLGLIVAGVLIWAHRPRGSVGPVAALLGVVWLAPDWVGWEAGPAMARSVAMLAPPLLPALLVHLVLAFPAGGFGTRRARVAVAVAYAAAAVVSAARALSRDPFLDLNCWSNCTDNVFLVDSEPQLARLIDGFWLWLSVAAGVLLAAFACRRLWSATRPGRATLWAVLVPVALAGLAESAYAVALLRDRAEDPEGAVFHALFLTRAIAFACLAGGVAWTVVRDRRTRTAISRLAADLGEAPEPGALKAALARSLADDALEVAYWIPGPQQYVDAGGRAVEVPAASERAATPIVRDGEPVALVIHDRALSGVRELEREIGAAARLAVDNERLRAEVLAQLEDLRSSRARIVDAGDSARRRIERDLHDGAQQRLLALSYELRLARAGAEADGDAALTSVLATSCEDVQTALVELRDLAHGIHPAILTEAGLGPALESLADDASLPVELGAAPAERLPEAVERAAYLFVAEAVDAAARAGADHVSVSLRREEENLLVDVGPVQAAVPVHLADRIGALGGRVGVAHGRLRAEIPCA